MQQLQSRPPITYPAPISDQWDYLLSTVWNQMLHLVIAFNGQMDIPRLCRAMSLVMDAEPLLACRFVEGSPPFWERIPALSPDSFFSVVQDGDPGVPLHRALTARLDPSQGPQARLTLVRDGSDCLVLSLNHTAGDAYGLKHICGLLARAYRALAHDPGFSLPPSSMDDRSFDSILDATPPPVMEAAKKECGEQRAIWGLPCIPGPCTRPCFRSAVIAHDAFFRVRAYSRGHGLTINDILLAAFFSAMCHEIPHREGDSYPVLTTTDLRRTHDSLQKNPLANMSVAFEIRLPESAASSPSRLASEVHNVMSAKKRGLVGIGAALMLREGFSGGFYQVRERLLDLALRSVEEHYPKNPFFSNPGIIPPECTDFGDVHAKSAYICPPVDYYPGFGVAASTYEGELTLVSGFCCDSVSPGTVERILAHMEEFLVLLMAE